jgi:hypothetical protein
MTFDVRSLEAAARRMDIEVQRMAGMYLATDNVAALLSSELRLLNVASFSNTVILIWHPLYSAPLGLQEFLA